MSWREPDEERWEEPDDGADIASTLAFQRSS